jgi:urea transporter
MDSRGDGIFILFMALVALVVAVFLGADMDDTKQRMPLTTDPIPVNVEP